MITEWQIDCRFEALRRFVPLRRRGLVHRALYYTLRGLPMYEGEGPPCRHPLTRVPWWYAGLRRTHGLRICGRTKIGTHWCHEFTWVPDRSRRGPPDRVPAYPRDEEQS